MLNIETNHLYRIALETDFSEVTDHGALKAAFDTAVTRLSDMANQQLAFVAFITQTAKAFHYIMLAAALLQHKAKHRHDEILASAPPEHSIVSFIKSQLDLDMSKELSEQGFFKSDPNTKIIEIARNMEDDFRYEGRTMRAMAMVSILQLCEYKRNQLMNPCVILADYQPTMTLIQSKRYSVIGYREYTRRSQYSKGCSFADEGEMFVKETRFDFGKLFYNKAIKFLSMTKMDACDRARTEEFRDFFADTLCRAFFELKYINFPRILNFVDAINRYSDEQGRISEKVLHDIVPTDCTGLIGIESILLKDTVDLDNTLYRVNYGGIDGFSRLAKMFNLLGEQKQSLLDEVVSSIKRNANGTV